MIEVLSGASNLIGMQGDIKYFFKTFGTITILFVKMKPWMKLKIGNDKDQGDIVDGILSGPYLRRTTRSSLLDSSRNTSWSAV